MLLCIWAAGDASNLLGAMFTHQLPTQKLVAAYFLILDVIFLAQYILYSDNVGYQPVFYGEDDEDGTVTANDLERNQPLPSSPEDLLRRRKIMKLVVIGVSSIAAIFLLDELFNQFINDRQKLVIGSVLAWVSGLLYFLSRWVTCFVDSNSLPLKSCHSLLIAMKLNQCPSNHRKL